MNIDIKCLPGGATVASTDDGIVHSRMGSFDGQPYLASNPRALRRLSSFRPSQESKRSSHSQSSTHFVSVSESEYRFKRELKKRDLAKVIRANVAGCLDACAHGVTVVVYPDAIWYGGVAPADVPEIVEEHLVNGRPVERLIFARGAQAGPAPVPSTER